MAITIEQAIANPKLLNEENKEARKIISDGRLKKQEEESKLWDEMSEHIDKHGIISPRFTAK